ncbi:hypothetical protein [Nocardioides sp. GY 10127]|uniref:hypothetical protein n=1 Tax=Nocardioides sp. GY 10127 TaxID=2569762 RepID=UPI0014587DE7|nr:hypothetical protein [Nocardioides sp. GY 10127]
MRHPSTMTVDVDTIDGERVLVAGHTYPVTFSGAWGGHVVFASGIDWYVGADGYYDGIGVHDDDPETYPMPWSTGTASWMAELAPDQEQVGQTWHFQVVGYRPDEDGAPVFGSRIGFVLQRLLPVVSEDELAAAQDAGTAGTETVESYRYR